MIQFGQVTEANSCSFHLFYFCLSIAATPPKEFSHETMRLDEGQLKEQTQIVFKIHSSPPL